MKFINKNKKKIIVCLVLVVAVLFILFMFRIGKGVKTATLGITDSSCKYGDVGTFTLYLNDMSCNVDAFDITFEYDEDIIEIEGMDKGNIKDTVGDDIILTSTTEFHANRQGQCTVVFVDLTAGDKEAVLKGNESDVVYVRYRVKKPTGKTEVSIGSYHLINQDGSEVEGELKVESGVITIE